MATTSGLARASRAASPGASRRLTMPPQPPDVPAERLGQQDQGDRQRGVRRLRGCDVRRRKRQGDPRGRGHDLAPVRGEAAARASRAAPIPPSRTGTAPSPSPGPRSPSPRHRPSGRRTHSARASGTRRPPRRAAHRTRHRPGHSRHPSVDRVQDQRDGGDRHQGPCRPRAERTKSATSAATPQLSVARVSVTRSAGPNDSTPPLEALCAAATDSTTPQPVPSPNPRGRSPGSPREPRAGRPGRRDSPTGRCELRPPGLPRSSISG